MTSRWVTILPMRHINEMNELGDMGLFPTVIYAGASANILLTNFLTWKFFGWGGGAVEYLIPWAVLLPALNILPVVLLRQRDRKSESAGVARAYPLISETNFLWDQHRFSSWVYAVAAANMFFWIVFSWWLFTWNAGGVVFVFLELLAFLVTFVPLWRTLGFLRNL